ncbi:hypothetical protein DF220_10880 [Salinibacterium hongtaonis]|uniref:Uncharacterized protein n=1 Tax=Homoserinimonas hongtaonis TaxID=2079791 RepID=A0A2U1T335_9MICO|nr:hypothetical protein DF220_10880 [Salinibacterium hongtaonis]
MRFTGDAALAAPHLFLRSAAARLRVVTFCTTTQVLVQKVTTHESASRESEPRVREPREREPILCKGAIGPSQCAYP